MKTVLLFVIGVILTIAGMVLAPVYFPENLVFTIVGGWMVGWNWKEFWHRVKF